MKSIDGAPETITHAQVLAAVEALGLDGKRVRTIRMSPHFVEVVLYATQPVRLLRDVEMLPYLGGHTDIPATHTIYYDTLEPTDDDRLAE